MASKTPMEDVMRSKITSALNPTKLEIFNDSHLHASHAAMAGSTSAETHFRVYVTSDAFKGQMMAKRHRTVYALVKEEMAQEGGIHALQLKTKTVEEQDREDEKAREEAQQKAEPINVKVDSA